MCARSGGSAGFRSVTGAGVSRKMEESTDRCVSPVNGRPPVASWYSTTPREKTSERGSTGFAFGLLGRHVARRAHQEARQRRRRRKRGVGWRRVERLRQAEVEDLHVAVRAQHDVFRLDIAMRDPARVRRRQRSRDLDRDPDRFTVGTRRRSRGCAERFILDELGDDEGARVELAEIVDHQDMRMVQRRCRTCFGMEPAEARRHRSPALRDGASAPPADRASCPCACRPRPCRRRRDGSTIVIAGRRCARDESGGPSRSIRCAGRYRNRVSGSDARVSSAFDVRARSAVIGRHTEWRRSAECHSGAGTSSSASERIALTRVQAVAARSLPDELHDTTRLWRSSIRV